MLQTPHPLDPNLIDFGLDHEHRIYAPCMQKWAVVDAVDYWHFVRYAWCIKRCKRGKEYLRRAVGINIDGQRVQTLSLYLHIEIQKRVGPPPSPHHVKVDHRDGDEWNCRRSNLRWATNAMNSRNIHGSHPHDLIEG